MDIVILGEILSVLMFVFAVGILLLGFPVAFSLAGSALIFGLIGNLVGIPVFEGLTRVYGAIPGRYLGTMTNEYLVAVPLFIFMGMVLERSNIAQALLTTMGQLFGSLRGGLALSVIVVGALLAASTGIVGATVVTMGLLSLPAMLKAGYDPRVATGTICASGTLGQIIPPSIVLILLADQLQGPYTQAVDIVRQGDPALGIEPNWGYFPGPPATSMDLFAGALLPGLMLVGMYMAWTIFQAITKPERLPPLIMDQAEKKALAGRVVTVMIPPLLLILLVLGSILSGLATSTEAGSVGAFGAMLLALFYGKLRFGMMGEVMRETLKVTCMVFVILLGASFFALTFKNLGGEELVREMLTSIPGGKWGALLVVMAVMFVLGFFLDFIEIVFVVIPIVAPALFVLGVDPIWLGILFAVNLQTSFLTPPFGFALFYLRGVAPPQVKTTDIYRGVLPYVVIQLLALLIIALYEPLATWLPSHMESINAWLTGK